MKNLNCSYSPEYQKTLETLYEGLFSYGETDASVTSEFWKMKVVQARECIQYENNRYEISKELFQLGEYKVRNSGIVLKNSPVGLMLNLILLKYWRMCGNPYEAIKTGKEIARKMGVLFSFDHAKQILSFSMIDRYQLFVKKGMVCVIGDGYGFLTNLIKRCFPEKTVICVNLGRNLIFDVICVEKMLPKERVILVKDGSDFGHFGKIDHGGIYFVEAEKYRLLKALPINLFVNICSMQEMDIHVINCYFGIMRLSTGDTYFYCCNRVEKKFRDGPCIRFGDYPWSERDEIIFDQICPWINKKPVLKFPFYKKFRPHQQRLIRVDRNRAT